MGLFRSNLGSPRGAGSGRARNARSDAETVEEGPLPLSGHAAARSELEDRQTTPLLAGPHCRPESGPCRRVSSQHCKHQTNRSRLAVLLGVAGGIGVQSERGADMAPLFCLAVQLSAGIWRSGRRDSAGTLRRAAGLSNPDEADNQGEADDLIPSGVGCRAGETGVDRRRGPADQVPMSPRLLRRSHRSAPRRWTRQPVEGLERASGAGVRGGCRQAPTGTAPKSRGQDRPREEKRPAGRSSGRCSRQAQR